MTILHSVFNQTLYFWKKIASSALIPCSLWVSLIFIASSYPPFAVFEIHNHPYVSWFLPLLTSLLLFPLCFLIIFSFVISPSFLVVRCTKIDFQPSEVSHTGKVNQRSISSELFWAVPLTAVNYHWGREKKRVQAQSVTCKMTYGKPSGQMEISG